MRRPSRTSLKRLAIFGYVWLMLGFFTGTALLLGPVRWMTTMLRDRGYAQRTENIAMLVLIGAFVLSSAALARWIVRRTSRCHSRVRVAVPVLLTCAAGLCVWGWMNPAHLAGAAPMAGSGRIEVASGAEFVFGPYPDRARLEQLKREGYTAVISLQHPAVVPFEPLAIAEESAASHELGITFIHAPMLPWVSSNKAALDQIRTVAATIPGKYYVHCGLGRDRVNIVKRMLELEGTRVAAADGYVAPQTLADTPDLAFERGNIQRLDKDLWLLPYPNQHEYFADLLSGQVRHVTLVLDPSDATERAWIDEARGLLTEYAVPFDLRTLPVNDPTAARAIVDAARAMPRPAVVIVPYTAPYPHDTRVASALLRVFGAPRVTSSTSASPASAKASSTL